MDAAVFADKLRQRASVSAALDAWQLRRQPRVRAVADLAGRLGALAEITNPLLRLMRDRVLPPLARMATARSAGRVVLHEPSAVLRARA